MSNPDQLTADLLGAGLAWTQLAAVQSILAAASSLTTAIKTQSDYTSDLWDQMDGLFCELADAQESLIAAMQARTDEVRRRVMNPTTHKLEQRHAIPLRPARPDVQPERSSCAAGVPPRLIRPRWPT